MKDDWNERARENARFYIATSVDDADFDISGLRDVGNFFDRIEHLLHAEQDVLDIGCGIGRMDQFVAPRVRHLAGIDVSGEMIRLATERMAKFQNVSYHEGDGRTLAPIADASIGLVFSHIVFQHMPRDVTSSYFIEVMRVLCPGGDFVFQVPEAVADAPEDPPEDDTFEMRFYDEKQLQEQLLALGFAWLECRRYPVETPRLNFNQLRIHVKRPL